MHYIKKILHKNKFTMLAHVLTGICLAFLTSCKADFFQDFQVASSYQVIPVAAASPHVSSLWASSPQLLYQKR